MKRSGRTLTVVAVAATVAALDQLTKLAARQELGSGVQHQLLGGVLTLGLTENPGAFLGLGGALSTPVRLALAAATLALVVALVVVVLRDRTSSRPALVAAGLLLGSGASNFLDRLCWHGNVIDFLYLEAGPLHTGVFNVADVAILAGAGLLLWATSFRRAG